MDGWKKGVSYHNQVTVSVVGSETIRASTLPDWNGLGHVAAAAAVAGMMCFSAPAEGTLSNLSERFLGWHVVHSVGLERERETMSLLHFLELLISKFAELSSPPTDNPGHRYEQVHLSVDAYAEMGLIRNAWRVLRMQF